MAKVDSFKDPEAPNSTRSISKTVTIKGSHTLEIQGYSLTKGMGVGNYISSDTFFVGGHCWKIQFYPDGRKVDQSGEKYVSLFMALVSKKCEEDVRVWSEFVLLDESGNRGFLAGPFTLQDSKRTIQSYKQLLGSREGSDVSFEVEGETFYAHKTILSTMSPVFNAQYFGPLKEESTQCIKIEEMQPPVFKALLHFIYCDVVPDLDSKCGATIMTQHLLAATDRYGIHALRSLCELRLCENIAINTVASTLALAEQHGCFQLKSRCLEFIRLPEKIEDVIQTDGFKNLKESCPAVIDDLFKSVARLRDYSFNSNEAGIQELKRDGSYIYKGVAHICSLVKRLLPRFLYTGNWELGTRRGYESFYKRTELEASQFIKDDCLTIQCIVGVVKTFMDAPKLVAQLSDLGQFYGQLLDSKEENDISFEVEGETFYAHKLILSTRSPSI
ncbi:hypothetical protein RD792_017268 [Penstemon davidsonii]|uniref:Uncharacterized protein n=1 Tax=Penstemon davidsonii TaxID=160366 RepID=A0ABR0CN64_9LAMI|nr:hypothetical protein RD792_017268 [Penstemon davidsonii]